MPASRIANFPYLHSVRPLVASHYPPEYHSFMYSADMGKLPRSNERVENYMFYNSSNTAWTFVMPIMLVTRTTIIDSAAICLIGSGVNNDGNMTPLIGATFNYVWFTPSGTSVTYASTSVTTGTAAATATATWTAGSKTVTLAGLTGTPATGQTLTLDPIPSASDSASRATPNGFGVVTYNAGGPSVTLSHAPTASGSGAVGFYNRRPLSDLNQVVYCNADNVPYTVYGGGDFVSGGNVDEGGFAMAATYDTAASTDLLGPEAFGGDPPYMDFPPSGESWGAAASYTIVNNCCVVDKSGGGNRGQGKALGLMMHAGWGNISPAEARDRLQSVRLLVTIRHRSSVTGGKGG